MRLSFPKGGLLLYENAAGEYVLEQCSEILATFKSAKKALAEYHRIRRLLEEQMPPAGMTDAERRELLNKYLADNLLQHNSLRAAPARKPPKSRTFG